MIRVTRLALLCAMVSAADGAEQQRYRVNGVELTVEHATGIDADRLIARHLSSRPQNANGEAAAWRHRADWRELASLDARESKVLQVRGARDSLEAILSTVELDQTVAGRASSPIGWIPATEVVNHVAATADPVSEQWLLRSAWSLSGLKAWLRIASRFERWHIDSDTAEGLTLSRSVQRLHIVLLPEPSAGSIAVITRWSAR